MIPVSVVIALLIFLFLFFCFTNTLERMRNLPKYIVFKGLEEIPC